VSALLARTLARTHTKIVFDVQGDWRAVTRLYGSPLRRLFSPLADALAGIAVRRVDGFRTIGPYTSSLVRAYGREPLDEFPTYMDLEPFLAPARSLPKPPQALFVGVLEPYKAIDVLVEAWRKIAPDFPQARLQLVGSGSRKTLVQTLLRDLPNQVVWTPALSTPEVAQALERSSFLVLPSRSEGMGRVVIESLCRGRPVLGSRVGGIRDLVRDGENGLLVEPGDADELAEAFRKLLGDPSLLTSLAVAARASAEPWLLSPAEFAERMNNVVELSLQ
jgi:glycosyltransferase involved in cell wall biosynthesis